MPDEPVSLSERQRAILDRVAAQVDNPYSLYRALHHVGDDTTKSDIEDLLRAELPEETYRKVVAIFVLCVDDDELGLEFIEAGKDPENEEKDDD